MSEENTAAIRSHAERLTKDPGDTKAASELVRLLRRGGVLSGYVRMATANIGAKEIMAVLDVADTFGVELLRDIESKSFDQHWHPAGTILWLRVPVEEAEAFRAAVPATVWKRKR